MPELRIPGSRDPIARARPQVVDPGLAASALDEAGIALTVKDAFRISPIRAATEQASVQLADDDVVEIELDEGAVLYAQARDLPDRLRLPPSRGALAATSGIIEIPTSLPLAGDQRGLVDLAIRGLRVLGLDPVETAGKASARWLGEKLDQRRCPSPGLMHWAGADPVATDTLHASDEPWLLFLHGTGSNTRGSFDGLVGQQALWTEISRTYRNRLLSLEHRTLTVSPVQNAIDALQALPPGAKLHLVSHSRGGLIGDLLCLGRLAGTGNTTPLDELYLGRLDPAMAGQLRQLRQLLEEKHPEVIRFVRVACPARGTILASDRLEQWLNVLLNAIKYALKLIPSQIIHETYDLIRALTIAVVKEKADASVLPGLEAMVPGRPLVKLLNGSGAVSPADLSVIEGDIEGADIFGRLTVWATDAFYGEDHDLVVNTRSMDGGLIHSEGRARAVFVKGEDISHFSYFRNAGTAKAILDGLKGEPGRYLPLEAALDRPIRQSDIRGEADRPTVFVVPGSMGSHLTWDGQPIWLDLKSLADGGLRHLAADAQGVVPAGLIGLFYADLCDHLARTHRVAPWPYDWRLSLTVNGKALAEAIETTLATTRAPVSIVAHSDGGLVARAALGTPSVRFSERAGGRLIMLGTPNGGSYAALMMLLGRDRRIQALTTLDLRHEQRALLNIVRRFPFLLEVLPRDPTIDLFSPAGWDTLAALHPAADWVAPDAKDLEAARKVRDALDRAPIDPDRVFYIAGTGENSFASVAPNRIGGGPWGPIRHDRRG